LCLSRDIVEFSRHRLRPQSLKRVGWHELRLRQPGQQTVAVVDPVEFRVHRGGNRIEEIQTERVGDEYRGRAVENRLTNLLSVWGLGHL
jgi:hypothetical protein